MSESSMTRPHTTVAHHTSLGVDNRKLGVWAFIGSETLFFATLITTYFVFAPVNRARPDFQDPRKFLDIELTTVLASILLASSLTMVLALSASKRGDRRNFTIWLLATVGLGPTFFVLTGFHGTHVAIGVIWLLSVFFKVRAYPNSPENAMDVEIAGLYWHFVDLVWVAIFVLVYLI